MTTLPNMRRRRSLLSLTRREVQAVIDTAKRGDHMSVGSGLERSRTATGHNIRLSPSVPVMGDVSSVAVTRFIIVQVNDDDYDCKTWDGTNAGSDTKVAKPFELRKTGWDGETFTYAMPAPIGDVTISYAYSGPVKRTASRDDDDIEQTIIPPYRSLQTETGDFDNDPNTPDTSRIVGGTEIYAAQNPDGGTGVDGVDWIDANFAARAWGEMDSGSGT